MVVKISPNDKGNPPGKLADCELHFTDGPLDGLKLIGLVPFDVDVLRAKPGRLFEQSEALMLGAVEGTAFTPRSAGDDQRSPPSRECGFDVDVGHPIETKFDEVGDGGGPVARLAETGGRRRGHGDTQK